MLAPNIREINRGVCRGVSGAVCRHAARVEVNGRGLRNRRLLARRRGNRSVPKGIASFQIDRAAIDRPRTTV